MVTSNRRLMLTCLASLSLSVAVVSGPAAERPSPAVSNSTAIAAAPEKKPTNGTRSAAIARASGREIFLREWIPNDPRSHGGDGLGPVFNESSCVSCHNQGGVGGGGAEAKNVMVISAVRTNFDDSRIQAVPRQLAPPRAAVSPSDGFTPPARTLEPPSFNDSFNRGQEPADPFDEVPRPAVPTPPPPVPQQPVAPPGFENLKDAPRTDVPQQAVPQHAAPRQPVPKRASPRASDNPLTSVVQHLVKGGSGPQSEANESPEVKERRLLLADLRKLHPGLATARSVVLHKSGTDPKYAAWRDQVLGVNMATMVPQFAVPTTNGVAMRLGSAPTALDNAGFFATLAAQSQQQAIQERLPPAELQVEKVHAMLNIMGSGALRGLGGQQVQFRQHGPGTQRRVAAVPTLRNTTALFGSGLIDSVPDTVLDAAAARKFEEFPEITGRVARLKDGRIGRFGWKAQKANLYDFTMTACAVELGLHVPDHPQAGIPLKPEYQPAGFDLNREQCQDLVQFLRDLPAPTRRVEELSVIANELKKGELVFAKVGCAACHIAELGDVNGIYSDLLLHDLGADLGDSGGYGVFQPPSPGNDAEDPLSELLTNSVNVSQTFESSIHFNDDNDLNRQMAALTNEEKLPAKMIGAGRQEWRTAPLWGVRDSAPYMHDGRAATLEQAIAFHGGEAQMSANRYFRLTPAERSSLLTFLRCLVAPETTTAATK